MTSSSRLDLVTQVAVLERRRFSPVSGAFSGLSSHGVVLEG